MFQNVPEKLPVIQINNTSQLLSFLRKKETLLQSRNKKLFDVLQSYSNKNST